jgi:hypothetical protein
VSGLPTSSAVGDYVVRRLKATGDPVKRKTSSAKLTEATTIEVDELDVVNRGLHQQAEFTEGN